MCIPNGGSMAKHEFLSHHQRSTGPRGTGMAPDCYLPSAEDDRERDQAVRHTLRTLECAASVGAKVVVLHLGRIPIRWPNYPRRLIGMYMAGKTQTPQFERVRQKALVARERNWFTLSRLGYR